MSVQTLYGQPPEGQYTIELRRKLDFKTVKVVNKYVKSCNWEYERNGGCGKCTLTLAAPPGDIRPYQGVDYEIRISLRNAPNEAETLYYRGFQEEYHPIEDNTGSVVLTFSGYASMLKRCRVNATFANYEVGALIRAILDTYVMPFTPITYTLAEHDVSNYVVDTITFDTDAGTAIGTLITLAGNFEYGVDRNLKFYFKQISTTQRHFLKYKKDLGKYDEISDYGGIINQYVIKGGQGFEDVSNNTESQAIYGLRSKTISNSAITTAAVSQRYGSGLLITDARPQRKIAALKHINNKLYEATVPLDLMSIVKEPLVTPKKYGVPIYGDGTLYGGMAAFSIDKLVYKLQDGGTSVSFNLGQPRPDAATTIAQIQNDINQVRNG